MHITVGTVAVARLQRQYAISIVSLLKLQREFLIKVQQILLSVYAGICVCYPYIS